MIEGLPLGKKIEITSALCEKMCVNSHEFSEVNLIVEGKCNQSAPAISHLSTSLLGI